jgi:hypothetical protein
MRLKDLAFLDRLERIRTERVTTADGKIDTAGSDLEYARAFRDYGVDVEALPIETSIDRLKTRPALAIPLAAALDKWSLGLRVEQLQFTLFLSPSAGADRVRQYGRISRFVMRGQIGVEQKRTKVTKSQGRASNGGDVHVWFQGF